MVLAEGRSLSRGGALGVGAARGEGGRWWERERRWGGRLGWRGRGRLGEGLVIFGVGVVVTVCIVVDRRVYINACTVVGCICTCVGIVCIVMIFFSIIFKSFSFIKFPNKFFKFLKLSEKYYTSSSIQKSWFEYPEIWFCFIIKETFRTYRFTIKIPLRSFI